MADQKGRLTVVVDNETLREDLATDWGFSCHIQTPERRILFDTGSDERLLLENLGRLHLGPAELDMVALSHAHWDHTGGLGGLLGAGNRPAVVVPPSFPDRFVQAVTSTGASCRRGGAFEEIAPGVFTTGEMGTDIPEQALAVRTSAGLVVITGCAHPGIVDMVKRVAERLEGPIHLLIGGFHLMGHPTAEVQRIAEQLKSLGVERVAPGHCTGAEAMKTIRSHFQEQGLLCGAGFEENLVFS